MLRNFYTSRLSLRCTVEQFLRMWKREEGLIAEFSPHDVLRDCITEANQICNLVFGARPEFELIGDLDFKCIHMPGMPH